MDTLGYNLVSQRMGGKESRMAIALEQAKSLTWHDMLYHVRYRNADGTPVRCRVNGAVKTWTRSPQKVQVPWKHGMHEYGYLTESDLDDFCLTEEEALT